MSTSWLICSPVCYSFQFLFLLCTTMLTQHVESNNDYGTLLAFKSKISHDPSGILSSWNESRHFCEWEGVTCGRRHRRVVVLNLKSKGLYGILSPHIGNLSFLRKIDLSNNSIQGEIPDEFGRLLRLNWFMLSNNSLSGKISTNLSKCSKLEYLNLQRNNLRGKIPGELASLRNLKVLIIPYNNLTGGIPPFLGNLSSLDIISAAYNAFGGSIPDSLGQLKRLRALGISGNDLSGTTPMSIFNLTSLNILSISENKLRGSLPPNLGSVLPNLTRLQISRNLFSGSVPQSLSNISVLEFIELDKNNFTGKLAVDFGGMHNLWYLNVGFNGLGSGEIDEMNFITSLKNCSKLKILLYNNNKLIGSMPNTIANLSDQFHMLVGSSNMLYGDIPSGIGNLVNFDILDIGDNKFTGKIPKEIGRLCNLRYLGLYENQLYGEIPSSLGNLSLLGDLDLYNNKLSGDIPHSIGNLKQLMSLRLNTNYLTGAVPKHVFDLTSLSKSLNLSQNLLTGPLPPNIGNLNGLGRIDVSDNNLSGVIPSDLSLCSSLEWLFMGGNFFSGSIPSSFSSMRGVRVIDLSHNNFSGEIPKFMEKLDLEYLNLSFNAFEGEVPTNGIFTNATAVSLFGNSKKLCGGIPEFRLPKCIHNDSRKENISLVLKVLIPTISLMFGLILTSIFTFCYLKKRRKEELFGFVLRKSLQKISYEFLLKATDGFSSHNLIGSGSFGSVYKGTIIDDDESIIVAVKVFNLRRQGASKSFFAECKALRNIRHRNLAKVITACSSIDYQGNDFKAVVYEYMFNGSLDEWLHPPVLEMEDHNGTRRRLTLLQRINIAMDVASALDYLHHSCHDPVLYCDLKPSNVLLDVDMVAKIGDFGLIKFLTEASNPNQSSSVGIRGTTGYAAPEYGLGAEVSTNGDIYSYGILLLEILTGKKPTDDIFEGEHNLHYFAKTALPNRVMEIVDPLLLLEINDEELGMNNNDNKQKCLASMVKIGVACSTQSPHDRMNIKDVIGELQSAKRILQESRIGRLANQRANHRR